MKFGKVEQPELIDFTMPKDHPDTEVVLTNSKDEGAPNIFVGCAKWNKQDLKNFYPRGTKVQFVVGKIVRIVTAINRDRRLCWESTSENQLTTITRNQ